MGLGRARTLSLPLWRHMTSEAYYDGDWHYLDLDVRAAFRRPDGSLASIAAARNEASLWKNRGPLFFPNDSLDRVRQIYQQTKVFHFYGYHQSGHTMDFVLRQGESFQRWWQPQGGRWHHADVYHEMDWLRRLIEQEPRGPKPNHRHFTVHNHGNGRFLYEPNLRDGSTDFFDGVYASENVRPSEDGVTLESSGAGYAVFEVRTPYIIVPLVGHMNDRSDDREASVVEIDGKGTSLSLSVDNGITWQAVEAASGRGTIDLTRQVAGRYGYLLRVDFIGEPHQSILKSLRMTTWVQVAPASLPSLRSGTNRMHYRTGDHYGLPTRVREIVTNTSDPNDLQKHVVAMPEHYDPQQKTSRIRGDVVASVRAMPNTKIAWFTVTGSFRTHQLAAAKNTRNSMAYAVGSPKDFQEIFRAEMPDDVEHWHNNVTREVRLDEPAEQIYLRLHGDPALNNFRVYAHCLDDAPRAEQPVRVTHAWREGDRQQSQTVTVRSGESYEIEVLGDPVNESIEIAVPSDS
jgi:hypothetical protein